MKTSFSWSIFPALADNGPEVGRPTRDHDAAAGNAPSSTCAPDMDTYSDTAETVADAYSDTAETVIDASSDTAETEKAFSLSDWHEVNDIADIDLTETVVVEDSPEHRACEDVVEVYNTHQGARELEEAANNKLPIGP